MRQLSAADQEAVADIARRHGFTTDAALSMLDALKVGGGGMAQFSHPEFGGSGQWMRGGMTMVGNMFDASLKARVIALCEDLAPMGASQPRAAGGPAGRLGDDGAWWPPELGQPSGTGTQNDVRYAYFAEARRLAVDEGGGRVTVYDTEDRRIEGVSQAQGGGGSLLFTSQHGPVDLRSLPVVFEAAALGPSQPGPFQSGPAEGSGDVLATVEKLAELRAKGVLTDDEFNRKKAELLARL